MLIFSVVALVSFSAGLFVAKVYYDRKCSFITDESWDKDYGDGYETAMHDMSDNQNE